MVCPSCNFNEIKIFHRCHNVPVNSVLNIKSREEALQFPTGNIVLGFCRKCGFIFNTDFNPELVQYSTSCEESQGYSATFNTFAKKLAIELIEKYDLHQKKIIEIGCGKGEFLKLVCSLGENRGIGFDPAYVTGRGDDEPSQQITFIRDFYSDKYAHYKGDMICCRMTLEHIPGTKELVTTIRRSIDENEDTIVFFQVPNVTRILRDRAFEDIYYEHCSYFSVGSLARLFRNCHFDVLNLSTTFNDQYILIECKPASKPQAANLHIEDDINLLENFIEHFEVSFLKTVKYWNTLLDTFKKENKRTVIWGSGSKGVSFLATLSNSNIIEYVVDINPYRQNTYMAGTGQNIVSPMFLSSYRPDNVIIMNAVYHNEILRDLKQMNLEPYIYVLGDQEIA